MDPTTFEDIPLTIIIAPNIMLATVGV